LNDGHGLTERISRRIPSDPRDRNRRPSDIEGKPAVTPAFHRSKALRKVGVGEMEACLVRCRSRKRASTPLPGRRQEALRPAPWLGQACATARTCRIQPGGGADTVGYRTVSEGCDRVASLALAVRDYFQCRSPLGSLHVVRALLPGVLVSYNPIFPGQEGFSRIYSVFIRPLMKGAG
jgi:hypothetical protein